MSSSDIAISVRGLCKDYQIAHQEKHTTLGEKWMSKLRSPLAAFRTPPQETFHALTDVSFDVKKGEVVGIIGRNGAGKSTLLKILSRITEPTSGEIRLYGRIASLLEVGTGFHPELTGRENVYLNGAIMGMKRAEITRKFDEIVAFAEVEKFLDTAVKRYSSGMYVRLAFAVAAHLEPEILIVDEVLAVGDAEFQKKCLGKMQEVSKGEGRTVLFVSHNMAAVNSLCTRAILLKDGQVRLDTPDVSSAVTDHISGDAAAPVAEWLSIQSPPHYAFSATRLFVSERGGIVPQSSLMRGQRYDVVIEGILDHAISGLCIGYALYAGDGSLLYWSYHCDMADISPITLSIGPNTLRAQLPVDLLNHGTYRVELIGGRHGVEWFYEPGVTAPGISVAVSGGLGASALWQHKRPGLLAPAERWRTDVRQATKSEAIITSHA